VKIIWGARKSTALGRRFLEPKPVLHFYKKCTYLKTNKISEEDREKAVAVGYSVDEILTIASMIEKEIADPKEMPLVASVIYNRLAIQQKLQMDCGTYYVERYIKPYISGDINRYNSFYNTYKCPALPAGPICNPGRAAIQAALNPESTEYLYFYSDEAGMYHFSKEYFNTELSE
jgi:uncharacterized YceG family protein